MLNQIANLIASEGGTVRNATLGQKQKQVLSWTKDGRLYVLSWYDFPKIPTEKEGSTDTILDISVRNDTTVIPTH